MMEGCGDAAQGNAAYPPPTEDVKNELKGKTRMGMHEGRRTGATLVPSLKTSQSTKICRLRIYSFSSLASLPFARVDERSSTECIWLVASLSCCLKAP